jgi:hypothetical protein
MKRRYENDERQLTMAEIERLLCRAYRCDSDEERGCYLNGRWFSVKYVLEILDANA